jgi:hypothetical protein
MFAAATPVVGLVLYLFSVEILTATLRAHGRPEPGLFILLRTLGWFGWLGWWYEDYARKRGQATGLDAGLFLPAVWPLIMVHWLWTGRKQALLEILLLIGLYLTAKQAGQFVYMLQGQ